MMIYFLNRTKSRQLWFTGFVKLYSCRKIKTDSAVDKTKFGDYPFTISGLRDAYKLLY